MEVEFSEREAGSIAQMAYIAGGLCAACALLTVPYFAEVCTGELRRTPLPRTRGNKRLDLEAMNLSRCSII